MNKLAFLSTVFICIAGSCKNDTPEAFAYGNFESEEIIISAESSGKLTEFLIDEGMTIKNGEYCGAIDTSQLYLKKLQLLTGLKTIKARSLQLDKNLRVNEVSMDNLQREKNRISELFGGGAATSKQLDDINGQIEMLKAQTEALASQKTTIFAERESLDIQILQINDLIHKSLIYSPVSGTVLEKYLYAGELAVAGKPLFKMADLSELILRVFVSGNQMEKLKIGEEVDVLIDTDSENMKQYKGTVSWVSAKSEFTPKIIQTRDERINLVYAVKVRVTNDGSLKIGMPGEIVL